MTYGPPVPYMECGNLVTVNNSYGLLHILHGMQELCNKVPHMYDMGTL